jgi:hypothetical protein
LPAAAVAGAADFAAAGLLATGAEVGAAAGAAAGVAAGLLICDAAAGFGVGAAAGAMAGVDFALAAGAGAGAVGLAAAGAGIGLPEGLAVAATVAPGFAAAAAVAFMAIAFVAFLSTPPCPLHAPMPAGDIEPSLHVACTAAGCALAPEGNDTTSTADAANAHNDFCKSIR